MSCQEGDYIHARHLRTTFYSKDHFIRGYERSIRQNAKLVQELRQKDSRAEALAEEIRKQRVLLGQMQRENSRLIESERNLIQDRLLASNEVVGLRAMAASLKRN